MEVLGIVMDMVWCEFGGELGSGQSHFCGWSTGFPLLPEEVENTQCLE